MKQPRQLTASGKAKTGTGNGGPRGGYEFTDRHGNVRVVGSMATSPQNDAGVADLRCGYEELENGVWVTANGQTLYRIRKLVPGTSAERAYWMVHAGLVRKIAGDAGGILDGSAWHCPRPYDRDLERDKQLQKALKVGLLSMGGRTYKLACIRPDTYQLVRAAGRINYTREALLDSMARGYL